MCIVHKVLWADVVLSLFSKLSGFEKIRLNRGQSRLSVCVSVASHISTTSEAIAVKFDKVTASVMTMHHISRFSSLHFDLWLHKDILQ